MKKLFLFMLMMGILPQTMSAQDDDDMYFVPSKKNVERVKSDYGMPRETYYAGINRSVDEYNRRHTAPRSHYEVVGDSLGNDIINFDGQLGVYPDSTVQEDFAATRQMSRWDGYEPAGSYWEGYADGQRDGRWSGWHSPWYYSSYYPWYTGWYDPWYDPWYYGYYGWYDPWYYGYYRPWHYYGGWYGGYPYWGWGGYVSTGGSAGTQRHGRINYNAPRGVHNGRTSTYSAGSFGGSRARSGFGNRSAGSSASRNYGSSRSGVTTNQYGNFGGSRSSGSSSSTNSSRSYTPSHSSSSSSGSFGGSSSFGGSRSSGGSFGGGGGSRSGGGGSFGGSRRR